jgi:ferredoxin
MRIVVDQELCKGHGVCMEEAPEVFKVSKTGELTILAPAPLEALREKVEAAIQYCPTGALSLRDGDD